MIDSAKAIDSLVDAGGNTDSVRMKGMASVAGALKTRSLAKEADKAAQGLLTGGVNADSIKGLGNTRVQATIGTQKSQSNSSSYTETNKGSNITTGNLALIATGTGVDSNININGSNLTVTNNALFQADNDFNVNGVAQESNTRSTNSSSSAAIGGYASTGSGQGASAGITASASKGKGYANSDTTTYANSQLNVGGTTTFDIGNDVNIKGGMINTNRAQGVIGGNVNIESLQDTAVYDSNQKNMGFTLDVDLKGAGSSLSVNGGKTDINADYKAVGQQSGIFTSDGGFDLVVEGKTDLIGGAITTTDAAVAAGRNNYTSLGGITTQDIENTTSYEGDAIQVGVSLGMTDNKPQGNTNGLGYGTDGDSDSSTTRAGITGIAGNSGINTDNRAEYAGALENGFDATRVNEELGAQTQITQEFGKEAPKAVGDFAKTRMDAIKADNTLSAQEKQDALQRWDEGGVYRVAMHTALGALGTGSVEGALTTGGVAAAAPTLNEVQAKVAKALVDTGLSEDIAKGAASGVMSLALVGAGTAAGLDTASTVTATNVDANNRQLHPQEQDLAYILFKKAKEKGWKRADGKPYTLQEIEDALRWANTTKYNEDYNSNRSAIITSKDTQKSTNNKLYDNASGNDYEARLWNSYPQKDGSLIMSQNLNNIKKPDNNLINFIKGEAPSYGYTWDKGINQPYNAKTPGPTPGKPKPSGNQAQKVTQKESDSRNQSVKNGADLRGGNSIQAESDKMVNDTTGMVFEGGKWVYKSFSDATKHTLSQTTPQKLSNALDDQLGSMSYKGQQLSTESKKAVLEGLMTSAVLYPHVFGFEPDFVMTSGGVAGATQGVSGSSAVSLHNGQGYSSGNYDIGINIDKSKVRSFSVDGSVVYGFVLDDPTVGEGNRTVLTANTLAGSSFTGTSCYMGACGAIVTTRANPAEGVPSRRVLMLGLGQTLGKGGTTGGSISGGVMKETNYNSVKNINEIKEQVSKIKPYR